MAKAAPGRASPIGTVPPSRAARVPGQERRKGLVEAARAVFVECGYDGARTREIAERAGTSEAVLYRHFASKDDLFEAAVLQPLQDWVEAIAANAPIVAHAASRAERSAAIMDSTQAHLRAMLEVTPLLGVALFSRSARGQAFYRDHFYPLLERTFQETARAMGDWAAPGFDAQYLTLTGFGTYLAHALDQHFRGNTVDVSHTAELFVRMLAEGAMKDRPAT